MGYQNLYRPGHFWILYRDHWLNEVGRLYHVLYCPRGAWGLFDLRHFDYSRISMLRGKSRQIGQVDLPPSLNQTKGPRRTDQTSNWFVGTTRPLLRKFWRRPTLPGGLPPSTIGAGRLNFRVRNGNGCIPAAITTRNMLRFALMRKHVLGLTPSEPKVRGTTVPEHSIAMHDPSLLKLFVSSKLSIEPKPSAD